MENKTKLFKSLSDFQNEVPVIHKATKGHNYTYADLPTIFPIIMPLLKKNGLGFTQLVNETSLKTIVFHIETGETIESNTSLKDGVRLMQMNDFQVLGSQITYLRRYALSSILGLVTDKDTDAQGKQQPQTATPPKQIKKAELTAEKYQAAVKFLMGGKSIDDLKQFYIFDTETEVRLMQEAGI